MKYKDIKKESEGDLSLNEMFITKKAHVATVNYSWT
jgi:hypothetical protein